MQNHSWFSDSKHTTLTTLLHSCFTGDFYISVFSFIAREKEIKDSTRSTGVGLGLRGKKALIIFYSRLNSPRSCSRDAAGHWNVRLCTSLEASRIKPADGFLHNSPDRHFFWSLTLWWMRCNFWHKSRMADCEDRKKKQVLGHVKTCKMKLDLKYPFHFFLTWMPRKGFPPYGEEILKIKMQSWAFQTKTFSPS